MKQNVTGSVRCDAKSVAGADLYPGIAKQCFCDEVGAKDKDEAEAEIAFYESERLRSEAEAAATAAEEDAK